MNSREQNEYAREGGGAPRDHRRRDDRRDRDSDQPVHTETAVGSEASVVNRRDLPGGSFSPARTPGALGPTTREFETAVSDDANPSAVGRTEIAIQEKPKNPSS
jgi:hypothetical protein